MKALITLLLLSNSLISQELELELKNMTQEQKKVLTNAYIKGMNKDLSYTLMAIAWQESQAGKWLINLSDPSFGVYHIIPRGTNWEKSRKAQKLLDFDYASTKTIEILEYWSKYHKGDWKKMVKSYNAGFNYNSEQAEQYLVNIQRKIKVLKKIYYECKSR